MSKRKGTTYVLTRAEQKIVSTVKRVFTQCYYCERELTLEEREVDHKIPVARSGETVYDNLVVACFHCNREKGSKTDSEYFLYRDYKKSLTSLSPKELQEMLDEFVRALKITRNQYLMDVDGFPIAWKCQAIRRVMKNINHHLVYA